MNIVVGLGNPGDKYKYTRHNAGFMALNHLIDSKNLNWQINKKFNAEICKSDDTLYVKPMTFMNNSGQTVQTVLNYYNLISKKFGLFQKKDTNLNNILTVIHDDIDIELGNYKVACGSRSAGHRGVESIIQNLKTKNFCRIRVGIKTPRKENVPTEKFVLEKFNDKELKILEKLFIEFEIEIF